MINPFGVGHLVIGSINGISAKKKLNADLSQRLPLGLQLLSFVSCSWVHPCVSPTHSLSSFSECASYCSEEAYRRADFEEPHHGREVCEQRRVARLRSRHLLRPLIWEMVQWMARGFIQCICAPFQKDLCPWSARKTW